MNPVLSVARLANVAGTQEPIYGPSAIRSVAEEAKDIPYTEITRDDLKWNAMDSTCVETQTFYLASDNGDVGLVQVIYSNVACVERLLLLFRLAIYLQGHHGCTLS